MANGTPTPPHNGTLVKQLVVAMVVAVFGAAIGFGISQIGVGVAVEKNKTEINFLRDAHLEIRRELVIEREANEKRISQLRDLMGKQIDLSRDMIALMPRQERRREKDE